MLTFNLSPRAIPGFQKVCVCACVCVLGGGGVGIIEGTKWVHLNTHMQHSLAFYGVWGSSKWGGGAQEHTPPFDLNRYITKPTLSTINNHNTIWNTLAYINYIAIVQHIIHTKLDPVFNTSPYTDTQPPGCINTTPHSPLSETRNNGYHGNGIGHRIASFPLTNGGHGSGRKSRDYDHHTRAFIFDVCGPRGRLGCPD